MSVNSSPVLLSICIPTRGRNDILCNTLNSIFSSGANASDYEVVIYDSAEDYELEGILADKYPQKNIFYNHGPNNGFLNLIRALEMGNGRFLKLHNDYSELYVGALTRLIELVKNNLKNKPVMFFGNGYLRTPEITELNTFDSFINVTSINCSWATAFGIWRDDLYLVKKNIVIEPMFPHLSLLLAMFHKQNYLISNHKLFENKEVKTKGGYNLFEIFAVVFLRMLGESVEKKHISSQTFEHIKIDLIKFLARWYCNTKILKNQYTFLLSGIKASIDASYPKSTYYKMILRSYVFAAKTIIIRLIK